MSFGTIVYVIVILLYVIYRSQQAKRKKESDKESNIPKNRERKSDVTAPASTPLPPQQQRSLSDVFREVEMNAKPYGQQYKPAVKQKNVRRQAPVKVPPKKEFQPVSTGNYSREMTSDKGTAYALEQDVIKQGEVGNYNYNFDIPADKPMLQLDFKKAIIANVILNRPEY
ncbi:MAG: hypothetical protein H0W62_11485 [Chitinophagales bacterium]|nr:hypothetical protein [Chitinophagales bacterium]